MNSVAIDRTKSLEVPSAQREGIARLMTLFRKRIVVTDSARYDALLAIPL